MSKIHVLVTILAKVQYEVIKNAQGRNVPQKIGLGPIQKPDIERRFNVALTMDVDGNRAVASKDVTGLFINCSFVPTIGTGEALAHWLDQGALPPAEQPVPEPPRSTPKNTIDIQDVETDILRLGLKESRVSAWCQKKWGKPIKGLTDPQLLELRGKLPHLAERAKKTDPPREPVKATLPPEAAVSAGETQDAPEMELDLE